MRTLTKWQSQRQKENSKPLRKLFDQLYIRRVADCHFFYRTGRATLQLLLQSIPVFAKGWPLAQTGVSPDQDEIGPSSSTRLSAYVGLGCPITELVLQVIQGRSGRQNSPVHYGLPEFIGIFLYFKMIQDNICRSHMTDYCKSLKLDLSGIRCEYSYLHYQGYPGIPP